LPGLALVVLDPASMMITDLFPREDAHAQERSLLDGVVATLRERDSWLADRNCRQGVPAGVRGRGKACFVIREHANLNWGPAGRVRSRGRAEGAASAGEAGRLYRRRWTIEGAFQELARDLRTEIAPLCYPRAALFAFCVGLLAYNVLGGEGGAA
jgi:hypothetical protein